MPASRDRLLGDGDDPAGRSLDARARRPTAASSAQREAPPRRHAPERRSTVGVRASTASSSACCRCPADRAAASSTVSPASSSTSGGVSANTPRAGDGDQRSALERLPFDRAGDAVLDQIVEGASGAFRAFVRSASQHARSEHDDRTVEKDDGRGLVRGLRPDRARRRASGAAESAAPHAPCEAASRASREHAAADTRSVDLRHELAPGQRRLVVVGMFLRPVGQLHLRPLDLLVAESASAGARWRSGARASCRRTGRCTRARCACRSP